MLRDVKSGEQARQHLLDEIRKRAEEAELARIEAEELKLTLALRTSSDGTAGDATDLVQTSEISDLRDALAQALAESHLDRATALYHELRALVPDDPVVDQFEAELAKLRLAGEKEKCDPGANPHQAVETEQLFQAAHDAYQKEQYDEALAKVVAVLSLDPTNTSALEFQRNIERAKRLSELVAAEERARKKREQQEAQQPVILQPTLTSPSTDTEPQQEKETVEDASSPQHRNLQPDEEKSTGSFSFARYASPFVLRHKWGIVLTGVLTFLGIQLAPLIYDQVQSRILDKRSSLLVVPVQYGQNLPDHLVVGLTDDLIEEIRHAQNVDVFGTATSLRRSASDFDGIRLAGNVGADVVLTLGMLSTPESVLVKLTLKRSADGGIALEKAVSVHRSRIARIPAEVVPPVLQSLGVAHSNGVTVEHAHIPSAEPYEQYLVARTLLRRGDPAALDSAQNILQSVAQHDSLFAEAFTLLGWAHILRYEASRDTTATRVKQAFASLQRSIGLGSTSSGVYALRGVVAYHEGRYHEAVERMKQAVQTAPSDAQALSRLALVQARVGRMKEALDAARQSVEHDPGNPSSHATLAMLNLLIGDAPASLREFQNTIAASQSSRQPARETYIAALVANNRHEQALDLVKQHAARQANNVAALYDLGRMYQLAGKPKQLWDETLNRAKTLVLQQLKTDPQNPDLLSYLALIETRLGNFKQGMAASARALAAAPNDYETLYNVTRVRVLQAGRTPEAYAMLARAIFRRFSLNHLLDLDLLALRRDQDFLRKITQ